LADVLLNFGMALSLLLLSPPLQAQNSLALEYRTKANFLSKFPSFIGWPENALPPGQAPFLLCVFGDFSLGTSLAEITRGTAIHERCVEIRWVRKEQELKSCQILFVSRSEQKKYGQVLEAVRGQGVLTVGETAEFLDAGGIVSFSMEEEKLKFDINLDEANRAHLRFSSRLLALARRVETRQRPGVAPALGGRQPRQSKARNSLARKDGAPRDSCRKRPGSD
jgi:YfiR/HmsC-like